MTVFPHYIYRLTPTYTPDMCSLPVQMGPVPSGKVMEDHVSIEDIDE